MIFPNLLQAFIKCNNSYFNIATHGIISLQKKKHLNIVYGAVSKLQKKF